MRVVLAAALVWLASMAAVRVAHAQQDDPQARFEAGVAAFDRGDYVAALQEFRASYRLRAVSGVLYNMAVTERLLDRHADASRHLRALLAMDAALSEERRTAIGSELAELERLVGSIAVHAPPGAVVLVDGSERGSAPLATDVVVEPGGHAVEIRSADGRARARRDVSVLAGESATVELALQEPIERTDRVIQRPPRPQRRTERTEEGGGFLRSPAFWILTGVVAVGAATAALAFAGGSADHSRVTLDNPFAGPR